MLSKHDEKQTAIRLRKAGKTYSEILRTVPVAKSTLSLWLREVGLAAQQKQKITEKRRLAALRGALARQRQRIEATQKIYDEAENQIGKLSHRELWLIGSVLYWAEGSKEKAWRPGSGVQFANSDPEMIKLFLYWLTHICKVKSERIELSLYIHENHRETVNSAKRFWLKQTGYLPRYTYFKKHLPKTKRKNVGENYHGLVTIRVTASSDLNRKIAGWTRGIVKNYWGVV